MYNVCVYAYTYVCVCVYDCTCVCVLKDYDPSHPNWEFLKMITEFRSQLQIVPLSLDEEVEEHRICVCVRKRPINTKGGEGNTEDHTTHTHTHSSAEVKEHLTSEASKTWI